MSCTCSSTGRLIVGSRPSVTFTITATDGSLVDPSSLDFTVADPSGTTTEYDENSVEVTNPSTGVWVWQPAAGLALAGEWWIYLVASGGGGDVATETSFRILDAHVPLGA